MKDLRAELAARRAAGLYRHRRTVDGPQAPRMVIDGREVLSFCSNDYLGLAGHPVVVAAFRQGADSYGVGSGAAHLVNGHSRAHHALEAELAAFTGRERALLFSTGYMANLGVAAALVGRGDAVFEDRLNHASLLDAGLLSGARFIRYPHNDAAALAGKLSERETGEKLVLTDGVFSMDGDLAPVADLAQACRRHDAWFMVDDAHGLGVLGEHGRGTLEAAGLGPIDVPILMGTLGKGLGTAGAFVAGAEDLIEYLIQTARTYIYTTAQPPAVAEATRAALKLVDAEPWRRDKLQGLVTRFRTGAAQLGLTLMDSPTPIQPLLVGDNQTALAMSEALWDRGILVTAIRPPTVPAGTARLRVTLSAAHDERDVDQLLTALDSISCDTNNV
ncbi:MAG TPA: 8-amino-7-oxononanoate synthase [Thioalkalivibrio sp.]|mgnify:FL=1|nr:8-amino-7-oxononanoate synthase [Thioalkalivibrio sp.]